MQQVTHLYDNIDVEIFSDAERYGATWVHHINDRQVVHGSLYPPGGRGFPSSLFPKKFLQRNAHDGQVKNENIIFMNNKYISILMLFEYPDFMILFF